MIYVYVIRFLVFDYMILSIECVDAWYEEAKCLNVPEVEVLEERLYLQGTWVFKEWSTSRIRRLGIRKSSNCWENLFRLTRGKNLSTLQINNNFPIYRVHMWALQVWDWLVYGPCHLEPTNWILCLIGFWAKLSLILDLIESNLKY